MLGFVAMAAHAEEPWCKRNRDECLDRKERAGAVGGISRVDLPHVGSGGARVAEVERRIAEKTSQRFHTEYRTPTARPTLQVAAPMLGGHTPTAAHERRDHPDQVTLEVGDLLRASAAMGTSVSRPPHPSLPEDVTIEGVQQKIRFARSIGGDAFAAAYSARWFVPGGWLNVKEGGYSDKTGNFLFGVVTRELGLSREQTVEIAGFYEFSCQALASVPWLLQQQFPGLADVYDGNPNLRPNVRNAIARFLVDPMEETVKVRTVGLAVLDDPKDLDAIIRGYDFVPGPGSWSFAPIADRATTSGSSYAESHPPPVSPPGKAHAPMPEDAPPTEPRNGVASAGGQPPSHSDRADPAPATEAPALGSSPPVSDPAVPDLAVPDSTATGPYIGTIMDGELGSASETTLSVGADSEQSRAEIFGSREPVSRAEGRAEAAEAWGAAGYALDHFRAVVRNGAGAAGGAAVTFLLAIGFGIAGIAASRAVGAGRR